MLTLIIVASIAFSLGGCFGFLLGCIFRTAACLLIALLAFGPGTAKAMTKHECMQAGYGCQWSKKTGGRHDGWFYARAKEARHVGNADGPRLAIQAPEVVTVRVANAKHAHFDVSPAPHPRSPLEQEALAATPPGASQVATWSISLSSIPGWPSEASPESQLTFQQVALLAYGARNFKGHWQEAWRVR